MTPGGGWQAARLSQAAVARALGVTQGHYSKVVSNRAPLTERLKEHMESWLVKQGATGSGSEATLRMQQLASSIRRECMELMHLAGMIVGEAGTD